MLLGARKGWEDREGSPPQSGMGEMLPLQSPNYLEIAQNSLISHFIMFDSSMVVLQADIPLSSLLRHQKVLG